MPLLYALGQHAAIENIASKLRPSEKIFAFLDDIDVVCQTDRAVPIFEIFRIELWDHAKIRINNGKNERME